MVLLEINPRPGASLDAYERALGVNLFRLHREGCEGRLAAVAPSPRAVGGSAIVQAHDLANTPHSGLIVPLCGDCHLLNFGGFATPERGGQSVERYAGTALHLVLSLAERHSRPAEMGCRPSTSLSGSMPPAASQ